MSRTTVASFRSNAFLARAGARHAISAVAAVGLIALTPVLFTSSYSQGLVVNFGIDALLALGIVIVAGYAGQISLAQAGFAAIGAYGSAICTVKLGWSPIPALLAAAALAGILVYALGRPILRLKGHFLAMATLAFNEILFLLLTNATWLGGSSGFGGIPPISLFGVDFIDPRDQMILVLSVLAVGLLVAIRIRTSRPGRALRAVRINETVAAAHGVNAGDAKTKAFVISAVYGSVAGSLYAHTLLYVNPSPFGVMASIEILLMAVVGGLASPWGAVVGAGVIMLIREGSTTLIPKLFGEGAVGAGEELVVGILLVTVLVLMPNGIVGAIRAVVDRARRRFAPNGSPQAHQTTSPDQKSTRPPQPRSPLDTPLLSVTRLTKRFGGVTAVDDLDLALFTGEILGVIGPNGAGKSTLINMLSSVYAPTAGRVVLDGKDITGRPTADVAAMGLARTFQTPVVFQGMTVLETVLVGTYTISSSGFVGSALSLPKVAREEKSLRLAAQEALRRCGLLDMQDLEAVQLSLGHQKVLEVARGLVSNPSILLLDEPAAGLNRVEKGTLSQLLSTLRDDGVSLLLVEHDMEMVMNLVDRVHVIEFGKTLKVGTPAEVRNDPEVIRAYLGAEGLEEIHARG
jgi:branched-chain amino acid transport system permease protein